MGLPDLDSAATWGGKLLVDRDGTTIGTCTQVFVDDATGLPEWAQAEVSGGPAVVPLLDAAEAGDSVRVAVRQIDVAEAPRVDDPGHISQDEEERLYRHYGIQVSREASESLLPVGEPGVPDASEAAADAHPTRMTSASGLGTADAPELTPPDLTPPDLTQPDVTSPDAAMSDTAMSDAAMSDLSDGTQEKNRSGLIRALAAGTVGVLAAAAAAVFWWRQRRQVPPTRKEMLAARAHAASLSLATRKAQLGTAAAPLLRSGRDVSSSAAHRAALQARAGAEQASVQARAAAERAAALAATARTLRLQRVPSDVDLEPPAVASMKDVGGRRTKVMGLLRTVGGFAAGYAVRARSGGARLEQSEQPEQATDGRPRRQLSEIAGGVQGRVSTALQAGNAQLSQRASAVAGKVRRRSDGNSEGSSGSGDFGDPA